MPEHFIPIFRVADAHASAPWYQRLGFELDSEHRFEPGFPLYAFFKRGDVELHLSEHEGDAPPRSLAYFNVDDLDAIADEFGVEVEQQPWGRELQLIDPDGNRLRLGPTAPPGEPVPDDEFDAGVRLGGGHLLDQLEMRRVEDEDAGTCLEMEVRPEVSNPHGGLHGGLMTALIECGAAGVAVRAIASENIVASDLHVRFLRPASVGPARVVGRTLRIGGRAVVVQVDVVDMGQIEGGRPQLAATATLSYARLDRTTQRGSS